jgi:hypothetical protein
MRRGIRFTSKGVPLRCANIVLVQAFHNRAFPDFAAGAEKRGRNAMRDGVFLTANFRLFSERGWRMRRCVARLIGAARAVRHHLLLEG